MAFSNTSDHYGQVAKSFHWLTALLIVTLIPLGWFAEQLPYDTDAELARKIWLFSLHKTLGVAAFFVALLRILWALSQPRPALLHPDRKVEAFMAHLVHWLLYGALVIVPLSGWVSHAAAEGFAPIWWPLGQTLPLIPKSPEIAHFFSALHFISGRILILSLLLHIAGALKHHVIDRDATLRRMLPGQPPVTTPHPAAPSPLPLLCALGVWAATLFLANLVAHNAPAESAPETNALAEVASDWTVQEGTITLSVVQMGADISGSFADWTAAITFDDEVPMGEVGQVTTTISIPSLTLGSVTQQALGPDFFDAGSFATAVYDGTIRHASDGYEAIGTLRIKDTTLPLTLPFLLKIKDDVADMRADLTLDRRDFGIGANVSDPASLGFDVAVQIRLTATRAAPD